MAASKPPAKPHAKGVKGPRLNFKLELNCACKPPICPHAGPGIAKLLEAAYAKGRADGARVAGATVAMEMVCLYAARHKLGERT